MRIVPRTHACIGPEWRKVQKMKCTTIQYNVKQDKVTYKVIAHILHVSTIDYWLYQIFYWLYQHILFVYGILHIWRKQCMQVTFLHLNPGKQSLVYCMQTQGTAEESAVPHIRTERQAWSWDTPSSLTEQFSAMEDRMSELGWRVPCAEKFKNHKVKIGNDTFQTITKTSAHFWSPAGGLETKKRYQDHVIGSLY